MRLIDADALRKEVDNFQNCYNGWSDAYDKAYIIEAIDEAPTINIVLCSECKYQKDCEKTLVLNSIYGEIGDYASIDFCSYGERIDNE